MVTAKTALECTTQMFFLVNPFLTIHKCLNMFEQALMAYFLFGQYLQQLQNGNCKELIQG